MEGTHVGRGGGRVDGGAATRGGRRATRPTQSTPAALSTPTPAHLQSLGAQHTWDRENLAKIKQNPSKGRGMDKECCSLKGSIPTKHELNSNFRKTTEKITSIQCVRHQPGTRTMRPFHASRPAPHTLFYTRSNNQGQPSWLLRLQCSHTDFMFLTRYRLSIKGDSHRGDNGAPCYAAGPPGDPRGGVTRCKSQRRRGAVCRRFSECGMEEVLSRFNFK